MRGDGDKPMSDEANISLLEEIVKDQRKIIEDITGKDASETPQLWALYKEVQEYYDQGMRVPEDVTLLFADDNWGNIRRLPDVGDSTREGGYGVYYHFDYVGGPRSYKWLNTTQISRVWEQMHLAYEHHAREIWIVNVGDLKPMEFPIDFFLDYAWDPEKWPAERIPEFTRLWAKQQFGGQYTGAIAEILEKYTRYNSRRKPELLSADTYSLIHYNEFDRIVEDYNQLVNKAEEVYQKLDPEYKSSYYQLVLYPVQASANLNEMYLKVAKNHLYAKQGRASTNHMADEAREHFAQDAKYSRYYHTAIEDGKWNHMMNQPKIGYTSWDDPDRDIMPEVKEIQVPEKSEMGIAVQGSEGWWPENKGKASLPQFDIYQQQKYYIDVFNRGKIPFQYSISTGKDWIKVSEEKGTVDTGTRLWVSINWNEVPEGTHQVPILITGPEDKRTTVQTTISHPESPKRNEVNGFMESNGYVSMEAPHFTKKVESNGISWQRIPNLGRTGSSMTPMPVTAQPQEAGGNSPRLEYNMHLNNAGSVKVKFFVSPTLNFHNDEGLKFAASFNNGDPKILNIHADSLSESWGEKVSNNVSTIEATFNIPSSGDHTLNFWMVDPGIVLQKIVVDTGGLEPGYLGPPESFYNPESIR